MSGRKGSGPRRTQHKTVRYDPYARPRASEEPKPSGSQRAQLTGLPGNLVGKLVGEEDEEEEETTERPPELPPAGTDREISVESQPSTQYSESVEDDTPVDYDALPDETTKGVPEPDDLDLWTKPAAEFIRSEIGLIESSNDWVGKRPLGEGGFGLAGLWERLGPDGTPVDVSGQSE